MRNVYYSTDTPIFVAVQNDEREFNNQRATSVSKYMHKVVSVKKVRKVRYWKFGSKRFQRQSGENQEKQIDYEMSGGLSSKQVSADLYDSPGVPSIVSHPLSL